MRRPPAFLVVPCRECGQPRRVRNGAYLRALRERGGAAAGAARGPSGPPLGGEFDGPVPDDMNGPEPED